MNRSSLLLITPEFGMARKLVLQLARSEYEIVAQSAHGDEVHDLVAQRRPDLVLMDIQLSDPLEGIALLAAAQTIHENLNIPVVFLTASSLDPIAELILQAHPYGYLSMPCDERELLMVLTIALNQHRTELSLQRSEERMQVMLRTSMDGFMVLDATGCMRDINDAACRITGYSREELLQMNIAQLDPNRSLAQIVEGVEAVLRAGTVQIERQMRRKDGQLRTIEMSVTCPAGPERLLYCFGRDITERLRARQELIRAKEEAETASQAKSTFLAVMSHELRTPLNVINGIAATLLEQKLDPAHRQAIELSLQGGQNLLAIIEEILDFTALQAGKSPLHVAPLDLVALLREVMAQVAELPAAKKLTVTVSIDPAVPARISTDARCLRQVLLNLLSNAVKFTRQGAVHLVVRPQFGASDRPGLHFSVVDTGIGIDAANRESIFEPFTQADASIKRNFGGTGLGLAISRSFVRLMGGELRLRSRLGVGSAFHFNLPYDPVPGSAEIFDGTGSAVLRGKRLLVAVTGGKRRRMLGALAHAWGMQVTLIDPAKAANFASIAAIPFNLAMIEAAGVVPGSPLRSWLDQRRDSRSLPVLWLSGPGEIVPDVAGAPGGSLSSVNDPAIIARELSALIEGKPDSHQILATATAPAREPLARSIPLSILAADDVQTNRQVLGLILRHLGYDFKMVENGAEVLSAVDAQRYDLVLIDVQMPVMDGLTAAREICRRFPDGTRRPRIVALTANALQGDRETCLAAGMDDYLTKPLVPATLAACIRKLFSTESQRPQTSPLSPAAGKPPEPVWIDTAHLRLITQGLPDEQVGEVLEQMHASAGTDFDLTFPSVQAACADHDPEALHRAIHGLKGCFQMLGWLQAAEGCVQVLAELRGGGFVRWTEFPDELQQLYHASQQEMIRYLAARIPLTTQSA